MSKVFYFFDFVAIGILKNHELPKITHEQLDAHLL